MIPVVIIAIIGLIIAGLFLFTDMFGAGTAGREVKQFTEQCTGIKECACERAPTYDCANSAMRIEGSSTYCKKLCESQDFLSKHPKYDKSNSPSNSPPT